MTLNPNEYESPDKICQFQDTQLNTLFSENYIPVNCRSSLEGVWQFAYQVFNLFIEHMLSSIILILNFNFIEPFSFHW